MNSRWIRHLPQFIRRRVQERNQVQAVLGNISWLSVDKVLRMGVGLVVGVWVARYLGPELFGQLNFALAFAILFSPLASLGLDAIVVRDVVREPAQRNTTLGTCFALRLGGGTAALAVASLLVFILRPTEQITQLLVVIAGLAFVFQAFDVIDFWFQARVESKYVVYARNVAFLIAAAAKVMMILLRADLLAFAWAALAEIVLSALALVVVYRRQGESIFAWTAEWNRAKALLQQSWPLLLAGVSIAIYMRIDQVMLGYMLNNAEVGRYSVAIKLVEIWYFIPAAIAASVFPALIKARSENEEFYLKRLQMLYDSLSAIAFVIAFVISLFSENLIFLLYGNEFSGAASVLSIYAWATIPVFLGVASGQHLVVEDRTRVALYRTLIGGLLNVLLNAVLIPQYGAVGAAFASLLSYTAATFVMVLYPRLQQQGMMMAISLNPIRWVRYIGRGGKR